MSKKHKFYKSLFRLTLENKTQLPSFYCILLNARAGEGEEELGLGTELGLGIG